MQQIVIHQEDIQVVHGRVMYHIFSFGDVGTLAAYTILRKSCVHSRIDAYKARNGKNVSGYNLLRNKTPLSLSVLKNKVPSLIKAGLCYFESDGSFVMLGNRQLTDIYYTNPKIEAIYNYKQRKSFTWKQSKHIKLVAIDASTYQNSKDFIRALLLHSAQKLQSKEAERKLTRKELLSAYCENKTWEGMSIGQYKRLIALKRTNPEKFSNYRGDAHLSLKGTARLLSLGATNSKTTGQYHRSRLKQKGFIFTMRSFDKVKHWEGKKVLPSQLPIIKQSLDENNTSKLRIIGDVLHTEVASRFIVNTAFA